MTDVVEAVAFEEESIPAHIDMELISKEERYYSTFRYRRPNLDKRKGLNIDVRFEQDINQWVISFGKYDKYWNAYYLEITSPSKPTKRVIRKYSKLLVRQRNLFRVSSGYRANKGFTVDSNVIPELQACKSFNYKEVSKIKIHYNGE